MALRRQSEVQGDLVVTWAEMPRSRAMDPTTRTARAIPDRLGFTEIARRERDAIAAFEYERVTACQELMRPDAS